MRTVLRVSTCAVLLVAASASGAVAERLITGKDIANSSVTGKDVKNSSLTGGDLKDGLSQPLTLVSGRAERLGRKAQPDPRDRQGLPVGLAKPGQPGLLAPPSLPQRAHAEAQQLRAVPALLDTMTTMGDPRSGHCSAADMTVGEGS